jgi:glycosyltransferase involved in cell wall biosynthesis
MSSPTVSIIVPTYNRVDLLPRALDSVLAQSFGDFEVLIIDDGSTDDTERVVRDYEVLDSRVRYLRQPQNGGVAEARNRGLREAKGEFVAFLDSDDEWVAEKLERQVVRFRELPEHVALLYGGVREVYGESMAPPPPGRRAVFVPSHRGDVYQRLLESNVVYGTSGVMLRRAAVEVAGWFNQEASPSEDYDYWIRVARHFEVDFIPDPLVIYYNIESDERLSLNVHNVIRAREWIYRAHEAEMRRTGSASLFLLQTARRHLEAESPDLRAIRRLALRAARLRPLATGPYRMLVRTVTPAPLLQTARAVRAWREGLPV